MPRRRGAASVIVALAVAVVTGALLAAACLPFASPAVGRKYLLLLAIVPVIAICLAPPLLHRLLNVALRVLKQEPLEQPLSWRGLAAATGLTVAGWLLLGLQVWLLLADMSKSSPSTVLIAVGAVALAWSLALLLIVFPGGIGAREVILVAALAPVLAPGAALAVALTARAVTTVSDLAWGGIGLSVARRSSVTAATSSVTSPHADAGRHVGKHRRANAGRYHNRQRTAADRADLAKVAGHPAGTAPS